MDVDEQALAGQGPAQTPHADVTAGIAHRRRLTRRFALWCAGLMLATIVLSAFMRLSLAGLGCDDWPACYGQPLRDAAHGASPASGAGLALARLAHRIVASVVLVLVIVLVLATLGTRPRLQREGRLAAGLLVLALALAALGLVTRGTTLPAVVLGNLLGGFVMLALSWRLAAAAAGRPAPAIELSRWARLGLALLVVQIALGTLISGTYGALACSGWPDCSRLALSAGWDWQSLNPWQQPALEAEASNAARGAWLHVLHRAGALLLLPVLMAVGLSARRHGHRGAATALWMLLALQLLVGGLLAGAGLPLIQVLLHNLTAALLLALLTRLA